MQKSFAINNIGKYINIANEIFEQLNKQTGNILSCRDATHIDQTSAQNCQNEENNKFYKTSTAFEIGCMQIYCKLLQKLVKETFVA